MSKRNETKKGMTTKKKIITKWKVFTSQMSSLSSKHIQCYYYNFTNLIIIRFVFNSVILIFIILSVCLFCWLLFCVCINLKINKVTKPNVFLLFCSLKRKKNNVFNWAVLLSVWCDAISNCITVLNNQRLKKENKTQFYRWSMPLFVFKLFISHYSYFVFHTNRYFIFVYNFSLISVFVVCYLWFFFSLFSIYKFICILYIIRFCFIFISIKNEFQLSSCRLSTH